MANGTPQPVLLLPNVITAGSVVIASLTVDAKGRVTAASSAATTGSGSVVLATSPTIVTPTIASFTNATHTHQNAAGGGTLDAAAIGSGVLALARGGTNADLSASGSSTAFLAQDASHVVTARAIVAADIPTLTASKISDFTSTVNTILASPPAIGGTAAAAASFSLIGVGQAAATYPVEITTSGFTGFIVKKSSSLGFSLSAYYPTLAFNMFYNGSNWVAIGAGPTGMWQQDAITGTMAFSMRATDATAGENMGSYGALDRLSITKAGLTSLKATDAATAAVTNVLTVGHYLTTINAGANNIGTGIVFQAADSTSAIGAGVTVAAINATLPVATHASRTGRVDITVTDNAATRTVISAGANGTAGILGFYGTSPIAQAVLATGASHTVDDVITALQNLGLVKQS